MSRGVLYLSYDGMLEPLGQSQVLAYLEHLSQDRTIHLISFEKSGDLDDTAARKRIAERIRLAGIHWHPLRYHKRPSALATAYDIFAGMLVGTVLAWRYRLGIVHARSYVASVMALGVKRLSGARFLFDMRGFWADERVDGKLWPAGSRLYRMAKGFERRFLLRADHVVSLTHAAVREMRRFDYLAGREPPFTVIPTCADLARFKPDPQAAPKLLGQPFTLGYVGSAGTWYLFDAVAACFRQLLELRPDARLLVINRGEHAHIRQTLESAGVPSDKVELRSADHAEVPAQIARMDASVFFIRPVFSKQASAPTKLGELLGCGVPCLANDGVGDMAEILRRSNVGVAVSGFDNATLRGGLTQLLSLCASPGIAQRCQDAAQENFSLVDGASRYRAIYQALVP